MIRKIDTRCMKKANLLTTQNDAENLALLLNQLEELIWIQADSAESKVEELEDDDFQAALKGVQELQTRIIEALKSETYS